MNEERRKKIEKAKFLISDAIGIIEEVQSDERDAFDNMPEGFQQSEKGEAMEEGLASMESAVDNLNSAESDLDSIQ